MNLEEKQVYLPTTKIHSFSCTKNRQIITEIVEQSRDTIEITLTNLNYIEERYHKLKNIFIFLGIFLIYKIFSGQYIVFEICFGFLFIILFRQIFKLIKKDSICFYGGLALRTETTYFCNLKSSFFVPSEYIFDAVINEVIENLRIKYILIIRTRNEVYKQKPIIPILMGLEPSIECLEIIYKRLSDKIFVLNTKLSTEKKN